MSENDLSLMEKKDLFETIKQDTCIASLFYLVYFEDEIKAGNLTYDDLETTGDEFFQLKKYHAIEEAKCILRIARKGTGDAEGVNIDETMKILMDFAELTLDDFETNEKELVELKFQGCCLQINRTLETLLEGHYQAEDMIAEVREYLAITDLTIYDFGLSEFALEMLRLNGLKLNVFRLLGHLKTEKKHNKEVKSDLVKALRKIASSLRNINSFKVELK